MTREQLDELWTLERLHLLQAAERALLLEDVLVAARELRRVRDDWNHHLHGDTPARPLRIEDVGECWAQFYAAIDRAEGA